MARPMPRPAPVTSTTAPSRVATPYLLLIRRFHRSPHATVRAHTRQLQYATRQAQDASGHDRQSYLHVRTTLNSASAQHLMTASPVSTRTPSVLTQSVRSVTSRFSSRISITSTLAVTVSPI